MISGFRREVDEKCVLLGHYAAISGNFLPIVVPNYHYSLRNNPEERSFEASVRTEMIAVQWCTEGGGSLGVHPPEIPKALQNCAKLNPI